MSAHFPPPQVSFLVELFQFLLDGHNAHVTNDLETILGRPARQFRLYAEQAAEVWR